MVRQIKRRNRAPETIDPRIVALDGGLFDGRRTIVLGIDQSAANFAVCAHSTLDESYFMWLFKSKNTGVDRLVDIRDFMLTTVHALQDMTSGIGHIVMEGYSMASKFNRELMGEVGATTKMALRDAFGGQRLGYPTIVAPQTLKKFTTGKGVAKKQQMLLSVYRKWDIALDNDNLADAYALSRVALALHTGLTQYAYEQDVIASLTKHTEWQWDSHPNGQPTSSTSTTRKRSSA